jgi:hypothetical protein
MEWLESAINDGLKGKLEGDALTAAAAAILAAIKSPLAVNTVPKSEFNDKNNDLKDVKAKLDATNKQLAELQKADPEKLKADLAKAQQDLADFQTNADKRELNRKKVAALERGLREAKAAEDSIDLLVTQFDLEKIQLDDKGTVVNWASHLDPVKTARKSVFGVTEVDPDTKLKNPNPGGVKTTRAQLIEQYNAAEKAKDFVGMNALMHQIRNTKE